MRLRLLIICVLLSIFIGCKNNSRSSAGIIPQKEMQSLLWDMMRADMFLGDFLLRQDTGLDKRLERMKIYQQIFAIHHINREQFRTSFSYYQSNPGLFKTMMDSLSQSKTETPVEIVDPIVVPDSFQHPIPRKQPADSIRPVRKQKARIPN